MQHSLHDSHCYGARGGIGKIGRTDRLKDEERVLKRRVSEDVDLIDALLRVTDELRCNRAFPHPSIRMKEGALGVPYKKVAQGWKITRTLR